LYNTVMLKVTILSKPLEKAGSRVFDAASSPLRMGMLHLLASKGSLQYTEIMFSLKLDPVRDAGKFVYHLKTLQEAGLITYDKETKKYSLTELGGIIVNFSRDIEEYVTVRKGKLFVRTSKLSIEEFDRNKIVKSLMVEAGVPYELAEEIATEAEERLIHVKTAYLTAPLIREFVNAILVERKLEEYRHKLTRLGMPVYDVTQSLKTGSEQMLDVESIRRAAGSSVMEEYVLLNCLPREISDAHMSGRLHLNNLGEWILKPSEFQHDLRYFLRNGLPPVDPPRDFSSALALVRDIYQRASSEVSSEQSFDMLNIFLAPYVKGETESRIVEDLELFINSIRTMAIDWTGRPGLSLALEFTVPSFLRESEAVGPHGKTVGQYGGFIEEARWLLGHIVYVIDRLASATPITAPRFIFKIREETLQSEQSKRDLLLTHGLASKYYLPYLAFLKNGEKTSYTASGLRLGDDWTGFWETDCQRTGCMDTIFINLPRIAYESHKNDDRFMDLLRRELDLAVRAFKIKRKYIAERIQESLLPTLSGFGKTGSYIHSESSLYAISPIGLNEAVTAHVGSSLANKDGSSNSFALRVLKEISGNAEEAAEESTMRVALANRPSDDAAVRLAELDVEEYGIGSVVVQGLKKHPYYTDLVTVPPVERVSLDDRLVIEGRLQSLADGGHLLPINLTPTGLDAKPLMGLTERILGSEIEFFTYTGIYSLCGNCHKWSLGVTPTCSSCGSNNVRHMGRSSATMKPLSVWPSAKARALEKYVQYSLS
jgi:anaerobic ribonucleoside-triphosphate reductase